MSLDFFNVSYEKFKKWKESDKRKMKIKTAELLVFLILGLMLATSMLPTVKANGDAASIWTDKPDYSPGETVTIFGSGFNALANVTVNVERPDGTIDTVYAVTDDAGNFTCAYSVQLMTGTYTVTATDGTNTATTTFTDTPPSYSVTISTVNGVWPPPNPIGSPVELTGTFSVSNAAGKESQYGILIDWGDGSQTVWRWSDTNYAMPYLTWNPLNGDAKVFSGTYNTNPGGGYPDLGHIYTTGGSKTITVKLFHAQPQGAESADAVASVTIYVAPTTVDITVTTSPLV